MTAVACLRGHYEVIAPPDEAKHPDSKNCPTFSLRECMWLASESTDISLSKFIDIKYRIICYIRTSLLRKSGADFFVLFQPTFIILSLKLRNHAYVFLLWRTDNTVSLYVYIENKQTQDKKNREIFVKIYNV